MEVMKVTLLKMLSMMIVVLSPYFYHIIAKSAESMRVLKGVGGEIFIPIIVDVILIGLLILIDRFENKSFDFGKRLTYIDNSGTIHIKEEDIAPAIKKLAELEEGLYE